MARQGRNPHGATSRSDSGANHVFASARESGAVTKSDSTVLDFDAVYVGTTGDLAILHAEGGTATTFPNVPGGQIFPVSGVRVMSTNTTASNLVWLRW